MQPADLVRFREGHTRWVLALAALQLAVLCVGLCAALVSGFAGFLALAAGWMFVAVRVSRGVVGNREADELARRDVGRFRLSGRETEALPDTIVEALATSQTHRRASLALSGGAVVVLGLGMVAAVAPGLGPWIFGLSLAYVVLGLGWAWTRRAAWGRARALVDAWCVTSV